MERCVYIGVSGFFTVKHIDSQKDLNDEIHQLLGGGFYEVVRPALMPAPYLMLVDEEGLLKNLPINPTASTLYGFLQHGCPICGPALIMKEITTEDGEHDIAPLDSDDIVTAFHYIRQAVGGSI